MTEAANPPINVWYFVIGGGFIGFWLFAILSPEAGRQMSIERDVWLLWGLLGFLIAGGFYAGRVTNENVRIAMWIVTGIFLGALVAAAVVNEEAGIVATFITGVGAVLIAAGLPGGPPHTQARPPGNEPPGYPQQPHDANPSNDLYRAPAPGNPGTSGAPGWQPANRRP